MFNICCDDKIPFAQEAFSRIGNVTYCKGDRLTSADLKYVDLLFIRSGTRVDSNLLQGSRVQFVASATAGTDHVDKAYLKSVNIPFYNAPGCNAESVVEYVTAALLLLSKRKKQVLRDKKVGIIGAGNVGGRLANRIQALGANVLVNDPPLVNAGSASVSRFTFVSLDELIQESDIISLHVPLVKGGAHPTHHLFGKERLAAMKEGAWLINASRGGVVSNDSLKDKVKEGHLGAVVLDVWEEEPQFDTELLKLVDIGTSHIAGYSYEGKVLGTIMIYEACVQHFGLENTWEPETVLAPGANDQLDLHLPEASDRAEDTLHHLVKQMYDIERDDRNMRKAIKLSAAETGSYFLRLRKEYPRRRTFSRHRLSTSGLHDEATIRYITAGTGCSDVGYLGPA